MRHIFSILFLIVSFAVSADIYKWVDKDGNTHFSDQPGKGAQKLALQPIQSYSAPPQTRDISRLSAAQEEAKYQITILAPSPEATLRDNQGLIDIALSVLPRFDQDQKIRILVDGKPVEEVASLNIQLTGIVRGAHTIQAKLLGAAGNALASSETIKVYMHHAMIKRDKPKPKSA